MALSSAMAALVSVLRIACDEAEEHRCSPLVKRGLDKPLRRGASRPAPLRSVLFDT